MKAWIPDRQAWQFSVVTFAAAALALSIAFATGLERPYWAATTTYIVAQPSAGALRSKGTWRLCGTFVGAVFAVLAVPNLVAAPALLALAFALWVGLCLTLSLLDQTPRSYAFILAGYTAAIIGFPSVDAPDAIFTTAILRVEEISLGIACAWVLHAVFLPRPAAPLLLRQFDAWTAAIARLAADALSGDLADLPRDRRRLAQDGTALDLQFQQARYEAGSDAALRWLPGLRERARRIPVIATAAADRVAALRAADPAALAALAPLLASVSAWVRPRQGGPPGQNTDAAVLHDALSRAESDAAAAGGGWAGLVREGLVARLRELMDTWADCLDRSARIIAAGPEAPTEQEGARLPGHTDRLLLALSGLAAMLAVLGCCAFWVLSAWPSGATAAMMAAVGASLFAQLDDPAPAIARFMTGVVIAILVAGIYLFAVLPAIDGFVPLLIALGLFYLPAGALLAIPALTPRMASITMNSFALLAIQESYAADFASFLEGGLAILFGLGTALLATRLVRSIGVDWRIARLVQADRRDLARLAEAPRPPEASLIAAAMLDRFEALAARLATSDAASLGVRELAELRAALNLLRIRQTIDALDAASFAAVREAIAATAAIARATIPPAAAITRIDAALAITLTSPAPPARPIALSLSGLRMALFPDAPPPDLPNPPLLRSQAA